MDQGGVRLTVGWADGCVLAVDVACRRPQAARLLEGRPVDEAVALAPRLFSLCGQAQGAAARLAAAAAQGRYPADAPTVEALTRMVALESIGEHLWRLLLDWPPLLGGVSDRDGFLRWRKRLLAVNSPQALESLANDLLDWLKSAAPPLPIERAMTAPAALLPWRSATDWAGAAIDPAFAARPALAGGAAETGALARQAAAPEVAALLVEGRRVAARLAARQADLGFLACGLVDLSRLDGWLDATSPAPGVGLARVETARGLLLHLIQVKDGRVGRYVIVAPTEWNFHPQGAFVGELVGSPAPTRDAAEALARRLALALDPCVSCEVVVEERVDA